MTKKVTKREASYNKKLTEFLKRAQELSLCGVEIASVFYSDYHNEPVVFPNNDDAVRIFTKFKNQSVLDQSRNMVTQDEITEQKIKKLKEELQILREENRIKELTIKMDEVLKGKDDILADMNPNDIKDPSYIMKENIKQLREAMKVKAGTEGSTSNAS